jgi:hypothetical protein
MITLNRLPATSLRTYQLLSPVSSHRRPASCEEAGCLAHHGGFATTVDVSTELGRLQVRLLRADRNRPAPTITRTGPAELTFTYPPGTTCFAKHTVPLERSPIMIVRDGDRRGNPTGWVRRHASLQDWRDDFGEHQDRLADAARRG